MQVYVAQANSLGADRRRRRPCRLARFGARIYRLEEREVVSGSRQGDQTPGQFRGAGPSYWWQLGIASLVAIQMVATTAGAATESEELSPSHFGTYRFRPESARELRRVGKWVRDTQN